MKCSCCGFTRPLRMRRVQDLHKACCCICGLSHPVPRNLVGREIVKRFLLGIEQSMIEDRILQIVHKPGSVAKYATGGGSSPKAEDEKKLPSSLGGDAAVESNETASTRGSVTPAPHAVGASEADPNSGNQNTRSRRRASTHEQGEPHMTRPGFIEPGTRNSCATSGTLWHLKLSVGHDEATDAINAYGLCGCRAGARNVAQLITQGRWHHNSCLQITSIWRCFD